MGAKAEGRPEGDKQKLVNLDRWLLGLLHQLTQRSPLYQPSSIEAAISKRVGTCYQLAVLREDVHVSFVFAHSCNVLGPARGPARGGPVSDL